MGPPAPIAHSVLVATPGASRTRAKPAHPPHQPPCQCLAALCGQAGRSHQRSARAIARRHDVGTFRAIASTGPAPVRSCSPSELTDQLSAIVCKRSCTQVPARPTRSRCTTPARRQPRSAGQPECALARRNRSVRRRWFVGCRSLPVYSLVRLRRGLQCDCKRAREKMPGGEDASRPAGWLTGLEPATARITTWCSTN